MQMEDKEVRPVARFVEHDVLQPGLFENHTWRNIDKMHYIVCKICECVYTVRDVL